MKIRFSSIKKKAKDILIWHYTSPEVLWKLLAGEFYATHYRFMNDSAEIIYGIYEFQKFLAGEDGVDFLRFEVNGLHEIDFFLLCFSEDCDNLYHWRSYTPNGGFSIGFSYNEMCNLFNSVKYDLLDDKRLQGDLVKCQYLSEGDIDGFMRREVDNFKRAMEKMSPDDRSFVEQFFKEVEAGYTPLEDILLGESTIPWDLLRKMLLRVSRLKSRCSVFKHPSFTVENEYRLVITGIKPRTQIEFIGNKPRIKIPASGLSKCIKEVYVSPHGDVEQNCLLAKIAKVRFGLDFEIHSSPSPFNGK